MSKKKQTPSAWRIALERIREHWHATARDLPRADYEKLVEEFGADIDGFVMAIQEENKTDKMD